MSVSPSDEKKIFKERARRRHPSMTSHSPLHQVRGGRRTIIDLSKTMHGTGEGTPMTSMGSSEPVDSRISEHSDDYSNVEPPVRPPRPKPKPHKRKKPVADPKRRLNQRDRSGSKLVKHEFEQAVLEAANITSQRRMSLSNSLTSSGRTQTSSRPSTAANWASSNSDQSSPAKTSNRTPTETASKRSRQNSRADFAADSASKEKEGDDDGGGGDGDGGGHDPFHLDSDDDDSFGREETLAEQLGENARNGLRALIFRVLDGSVLPRDGRCWHSVSIAYQFIVMFSIIATITIYLIETQPHNVGNENVALEYAVVALFTVDYVLRFLFTREARFWLPLSWRCQRVTRAPRCVRCCVGPPRPRHGDEELDAAQRRAGFFWQALNQVDFWSVAPFYILYILEAADTGGFAESADSSAFTSLRVMRLFRVFRIFKAAKYSRLLRVVGETLRRSFNALFLLFASTTMAALFFGTLIFYAENLSYATFEVATNETEARWAYADGSDSAFQSAAESVYWAFVTLTTVGYGDIYPISTAGRFVAVVTVLSGLVVLALPIGIIGSHFSDVMAAIRSHEVEEYLVKLDREKTKKLTNIDMLKIISKELRAQAAAINEVQAALDNVGVRWRLIETAHAVLDRRIRDNALSERAEMPKLNIGFDSSRMRTESGASDTERMLSTLRRERRSRSDTGASDGGVGNVGTNRRQTGRTGLKF